jgi:hypothetical protein
MISVRDPNYALPHGERGEIPPATNPRHAWLSILLIVVLHMAMHKFGERSRQQGACVQHIQKALLICSFYSSRHLLTLRNERQKLSMHGA